MMMMMMDDASDKDKLTCCVYVFSKWYYKIVQCALGLTQNPEENSSNKSPFQLFCVCSVILSVNSAFQRPVLGMSMRKNDHEL